MSYQKNLQVPYHQQDTHYYCGAASAQMVLDSAGAGLLGQDGLYTDCHNHTTWDQNLFNAFGQKIDWATNPDGLTWTMNNRDVNHYYVQYQLANEDAITRKIAWTIEHYGVAPSALVLGSQHWIVVRGMDVSAAPKNSDDVTFSVNNLRVNDPWPPVPAWNKYTSSYAQNLLPPPPHGAGDNCGTGGNRGVADSVITYADWEDQYMTGADYHAQGHWQGKFVAVCDPDPPPERRGIPARVRHAFAGETLINRDQVLGLAAAVVKNYPFPEDANWTRSLRRAKPADAILVQRLGRDDDYYYVVPLSTADRVASAALTVNARFGQFLQATVFPQPEPRLLNLPSREAVLKSLLGRRIELPGYRGTLRLREGAVAMLDHWVWKPCLESLSPFWPFRVVVTGTQTLYVRIDGEMFTALTDNVLGI